MTTKDAGIKLYAWIGEDEFGSGVIGLKQALVPAGYIPLVAVDRAKIDRPAIRDQLSAQARLYGKTIRLAEFEVSKDALVLLLPDGSEESS
jgi:hypothetical protein